MNSNRAQTGMTSEALGVSVAPSFFQSCVADGKTARMEDVKRFKVTLSLLLTNLLLQTYSDHCYYYYYYYYYYY